MMADTVEDLQARVKELEQELGQAKNTIEVYDDREAASQHGWSNVQGREYASQQQVKTLEGELGDARHVYAEDMRDAGSLHYELKQQAKTLHVLVRRIRDWPEMPRRQIEKELHDALTAASVPTEAFTRAPDGPSRATMAAPLKWLETHQPETTVCPCRHTSKICSPCYNAYKDFGGGGITPGCASDCKTPGCGGSGTLGEEAT